MSYKLKLKKRKKKNNIYTSIFTFSLLTICTVLIGIIILLSLDQQKNVLGITIIPKNCEIAHHPCTNDHSDYVHQRETYIYYPTATIVPSPTVSSTIIPENIIQQFINQFDPSSTPTNSPTIVPTDTQVLTGQPTNTPSPIPTVVLLQPTASFEQNNNLITNFFHAVSNIILPTQQIQPTQSIAAPTPTQTLQSNYYSPEPPTPTPITTVKVKRPDGTQIELTDDALVKMSNILQYENLPQIKKLSEGNFAIIKNGVQAATTFPISINLASNHISVTTEGGEKIIAISPDQAIKIAKDKNIISTIINQDGSQMQLASYEGDPVYIIKGSITKKVSFFFFIKLNLPLSKVTYISTETGEVVKIDQTPVSQILNNIPSIN